MTTNAATGLPKHAKDYLQQVMIPGYDKLLKEQKPWFGDACENGLQCTECPEWLGQWLCPDGLDRARLAVFFREPAEHKRVCLFVHSLRTQFNMTMEDATDADWGDKFGETVCPASSAKIIGIVSDGAIVETIVLYRDPSAAITAINEFIDAELYASLGSPPIP